jgi:hypothetical protein
MTISLEIARNCHHSKRLVVSRGHGSAQRFILGFLADHPGEWWSAWELGEMRWGRYPTRTEVQAMRNAIRRLESAPGVEVEEIEPYPGITGQLQDAEGRWRPKRAFPTLLIGRDAPKLKKRDWYEEYLERKKLIESIRIVDDPGF